MELLNPPSACFLHMTNGYQIGKRRINNGLKEVKAKIGSEIDTATEKELSLLV